MPLRSIVVVLLVAGWVAPAWAASECLKDLTTLDQRFALGVTGTQPGDGAATPRQAPTPPANAPAAAPPATSSQLDSVPNTGGVVDRPADQLQPLSSDARRRVTTLLEEAKAADAKGDGTMCADRLKQARQLAQQPSDSPSDLH